MCYIMMGTLGSMMLGVTGMGLYAGWEDSK